MFYLGAKPQAEQMESALKVLSPEQRRLFTLLQPQEQAHSLEVYDRLVDQGEKDANLLAAALLHDIGKAGYPVHIWERVVVVVMKAVFPNLVKTWGQKPETARWQRPFIVAEKHPLWGAALAQAAGVSPLTYQLILRHQQPRQSGGDSLEDSLLHKLQIVDNG
jgi:hypothetical protein